MIVLDDKQKAEILTPGARRIIDALRAKGEARVVGGAVRDVLMGRKAGDIDLASVLPPDQVVEILNMAGIKVAPTGIAHGTVTAVVDHVGYEITTLRRDVATDGRHAEVEFTDDWRADAARRDFTFNALYVDSDGKLYDYFGGVEDAAAGRVRFIGDAGARIREDVLRILRFFRFYAWFGRDEIDAKGLAACRELAGSMPRLSAERVARETLKLLAAENPLVAWELMLVCGVAQAFTAEATNVTRLQALLDAEDSQGEEMPAIVRLAALLPQEEKAAVAVAARLKLSNRDAAHLRVLAILPGLLCDDPLALRKALYVHGAENCRAAAFLRGEKLSEMLAVIDAWENSVFPLKGEDIVALGVAAGPRVGEILKNVEEWWSMGDFRADREACLSHAKLVCGKNH